MIYTNELVKRKQNFEKLTRTVTMVKEGGKIDQHLDLIAGFQKKIMILSVKHLMMYLHLRPEELQLRLFKNASRNRTTYAS